MNRPIPKYTTTFSFGNKIYRLAWVIVSTVLYRPFSLRLFNSWRVLLLRMFGARIDAHSIIYSSAKIWMPCNLVVGQHSCIGPNTYIYNPATITIGDKVTISQFSYLCAGSHEISSLSLDFISAPISIKDFVWVCANCFIMMGVTIEEGCVIGACSSVFKDTNPWGVYGGTPARFIKTRIIQNERSA